MMATWTDPYPGDPKLKLMTLGQMGDYLLKLRGSGYMSAPGPNGEQMKLTETLAILTPVDLAKLTQIITALRFFEEKEKAQRR